LPSIGLLVVDRLNIYADPLGKIHSLIRAEAGFLIE